MWVCARAVWTRVSRVNPRFGLPLGRTFDNGVNGHEICEVDGMPRAQPVRFRVLGPARLLENPTIRDPNTGFTSPEERSEKALRELRFGIPRVYSNILREDEREMGYNRIEKISKTMSLAPSNLARSSSMLRTSKTIILFHSRERDEEFVSP